MSKKGTATKLPPAPVQCIRLGRDEKEPYVILTLDTKYEHAQIGGTDPDLAVNFIATRAKETGLDVFSVHDSLPGAPKIDVRDIPDAITSESPAVVFATDEKSMSKDELKRIGELASTSMPSVCLVSGRGGGRLIVGFEDRIEIFVEGKLRTIIEE